jgi:hypothetical protein
MKPREYMIMQDCVGVGIQRGWARAHKHQESPTPGQIQAAIEDAVMLEIQEYFTFEDDAE